MFHEFIVIHHSNIFTNIKDGHRGIIKLSLGFNVLLQKSLSDLEQAKLSEVNPLDWAKVSANVKKWELDMLGEMVVVELFLFYLLLLLLWDLFVVSLIAFHIVEVLLSNSISLSK